MVPAPTLPSGCWPVGVNRVTAPVADDTASAVPVVATTTCPPGPSARSAASCARCRPDSPPIGRTQTLPSLSSNATVPPPIDVVTPAAETSATVDTVAGSTTATVDAPTRSTSEPSCSTSNRPDSAARPAFSSSTGTL